MFGEPQKFGLFSVRWRRPPAGSVERWFGAMTKFRGTWPDMLLSDWGLVGVGRGSAGGSLMVGLMLAVWVKPATVGEVRGLLCAMASLFKEGSAAKRPFLGASSGSQGSGEGRLTREQLDELVVKTAQLASVHDVEIRELKTSYRRVSLGVTSRYGALLKRVDEQWKVDRGTGKTGGTSKHVRLAVTLFGEVFGDDKVSGEVKAKLKEVFGEVDASKDEGVTPWVQVMKFRTFKGDKEGILEFKLVPELGAVEGEIVRVLQEYGGKVKSTPEPRGPLVRKVDELLEGTWRK